ncbi:MAG: aminotransferase class V-fold PLP-dependent enzyme [Muribaculaceae bacterium]|nr:aminotransferase class V-fold PLP-dependent enzyme [Muribaculaceae bacterium]
MSKRQAYQKADAYGALNMPVYHTLAYEFSDQSTMADAFCGRSDDPDYSRVTNPTVIYFEKRVRELTGAAHVTALSSGMAAISAAVMTLASSGKNIVTSRHLFGNTFLLFNDLLGRFGVQTRYVDLTDASEAAKAIDADTCCVFMEIMTNPQMEVADIAALSAVCRAHGVPLLADTTMIPFTHFRASELGIDVEIVSSTKYLGSGGTSLGGLIIDYGHIEGFNSRLRKEMVMNLGAYMTPHAAYMQTLALESLHVRYARQQANAMAVAEALSKLPGVRVNYPGLPGNPARELCEKQFGGNFSAMLTFDLPTPDDCTRFINALKLVHRSTNLFDTRSLAIHPASTIFGPLTEEQRRDMDISPTLIRFSAGLENPDDIINDLVNAINQI